MYDSYIRMNCGGDSTLKRDDNKSLEVCDQIDAAIDHWAESLVAIIEASDNPEESLLRAHLAIATKHKELEILARRELEARGHPSGVAHG